MELWPKQIPAVRTDRLDVLKTGRHIFSSLPPAYLESVIEDFRSRGIQLQPD
jgi:hypothetical protein